MDILITENQLRRIISEQKFEFKPSVDNVPKSDYLGKGGEFERSQRSKENLHLDKNPITAQTYSNRAIELIKSWEVFKNKEYLCPSGKRTIGYGTRIDFHPELANTCITEAKAIELLKQDLDKNVVTAIKKFVKVPLTQNQFDALCSLIYNIGRKTFVNSKLLNDINSGNIKSIIKNWSEFRMGSGGVSNGLVNRRSKEINLFRS